MSNKLISKGSRPIHQNIKIALKWVETYVEKSTSGYHPILMKQNSSIKLYHFENQALKITRKKAIKLLGRFLPRCMLQYAVFRKPKRA